MTSWTVRRRRGDAWNRRIGKLLQDGRAGSDGIFDNLEVWQDSSWETPIAAVILGRNFAGIDAADQHRTLLDSQALCQLRWTNFSPDASINNRYYRRYALILAIRVALLGMPVH
jgi:hypothetical protein